MAASKEFQFSLIKEKGAFIKVSNNNNYNYNLQVLHHQLQFPKSPLTWRVEMVVYKEKGEGEIEGEYSWEGYPLLLRYKGHSVLMGEGKLLFSGFGITGKVNFIPDEARLLVSEDAVGIVHNGSNLFTLYTPSGLPLLSYALERPPQMIIRGKHGHSLLSFSANRMHLLTLETKEMWEAPLPFSCYIQKSGVGIVTYDIQYQHLFVYGLDDLRLIHNVEKRCSSKPLVPHNFPYILCPTNYILESIDLVSMLPIWTYQFPGIILSIEEVDKVAVLVKTSFGEELLSLKEGKKLRKLNYYAYSCEV